MTLSSMPLRPASKLTAFPAAIAALVTLAAMALVAAPSSAQAGETPSSLQGLLADLPEPPASVRDAAAWVDKSSGRVVQRQFSALLAALLAHRRAMDAIGHADDGRRQAQAQAQRQDLAQGMAGIGIDPERMQRDPAYARQVQERMRSMPPEQLMAMAQRMNQPMQHDKRLSNEAVQMGDETAGVRAAGDAGDAYVHRQAARTQARQAIWREAEEQAARILGAPLQTRLPKPRTEWDNPGCDTACNARWQAYAEEAFPLLLARENEALRLRRAALQKLRNALTPEVGAGDRLLASAQYGAAAKSQLYLLRIAGYDAALVGEIERLSDWTAEAARHAAALAHCGKQVVLAPGTVCP